MSFGFLDHAVDVLLGQSTAAGDGHGLLLAGALVLSGHVHDAVGVDVEGNLDLGHTVRGRSDTGQLEGAQRLVVTGELTLTLVDLDQHGRLVVFSGGEDLAALSRDGGVALDQLGHDATLGFDTQGQRGHVDQQHVLAVTLDNTGLQGGTDGHNLVGVNALVGLLTTGQLADNVADSGHTGGTTHQHHVVNVAELYASILDYLVERQLGAL